MTIFERVADVCRRLLAGECVVDIPGYRLHTTDVFDAAYEFVCVTLEEP